MRYDASMRDGYETLDEAASRLRIHKSTLQRYLAAGKLHRYKLPGERRTLVRSEAVDELRKPALQLAGKTPAKPAKRVSSPSRTG